MGNRKQPTPAPGPGFKPDPPPSPPTCRAPEPPSTPQGAGRVVPYLPPDAAILIGSALVHAYELLDSLLEGEHKGLTFDIYALRGTLGRPQVQAWLASFPPGLLPVKRSER